MKQAIRLPAKAHKGPTIADLPALARLRYDPIRDRCYWLTEHKGWMNINDINVFCLGYILRKLAAEDKIESRYYQVVECCARRRGASPDQANRIERTGWEHGD